MAKVVIHGTEYDGVPGVDIPNADTPGNTRFLDTSDATLDNGNKMLSGNTAYANGTKYTGTIASKTSADLTASGDTVTVPAGHYASNATKAVSGGTATTPATTITANPTISISSGGLITATVSASQSVTPSVSEGYISAGTAGTVSVSGSKTQQMTTQAATTITPTTSNQEIAAGTYLTGKVTVAGDSDLKSSNIVEGATIFNVQGSAKLISVSQDSQTGILTIS